MKLNALSGGLIDVAVQMRQKAIVETLLGLVVAALMEDGRGPSWPREWSDGLFTPAREFTQRKRARKFLHHLKSLGAPVDDWIDAIEAPPDTARSQQAVGPPPSAEGGVGRAYMLGKFVVKITTDPKEARVASFLAGKDVPFLAKFYDVWEVAGAGGEVTSGHKKLYAIVQDKLNVGVSGKYRVAGNAVYSYLDDNNRPLEDPALATKTVVRRYLNKKLRDDKGVVRAVFKLFAALKAIYDATGVLLQDPHGGNLAFKGRDVGFFDAGRSSRFDATEMPAPRSF